jgi:hypothetical protein
MYVQIGERLGQQLHALALAGYGLPRPSAGLGQAPTRTTPTARECDGSSRAAAPKGIAFAGALAFMERIEFCP